MALADRFKKLTRPNEQEGQNPLWPVYWALHEAEAHELRVAFWRGYVRTLPRGNNAARAVAQWVEQTLVPLGPLPAVEQLGRILLDESAGWEAFGLPETVNDTTMNGALTETLKSAMRDSLISYAQGQLRALAGAINEEFPGVR